MESHEHIPTGRYPGPPETIRTVAGLGITRMAAPPRTQSYEGLIQEAAPMADTANAYDIPMAYRPAGASPPQNYPEDDAWNPPLTGRTLAGGFSPEPSPHPYHTQTSQDGEGLRESMPSVWERVAKRTHYAHLGDDRDTETGTGRNADRDVDTMSLDSLQMEDELAGAGAGAGARGLSSRGIAGQAADYDTYKRTLAAHRYPTLPSKPPADVKIGRTSGLAIWLLIMSVYSTLMSGLWLGAAIAMPRWGTTVSSHGAMTLSTANLVTAILAKTIEISFATVFVAFIGQVLTRRAITTKEGMTLSEMSMRTWVTQPGSLLANAKTLKYAGRTVLGIMTLLATLVVILYTTASDTMLSPKLQLDKWRSHQLMSYVKTSYANSLYIESKCATPISVAMDEMYSAESCFDIQNAGNSWPDILNFVSEWAYTTNTSMDMVDRPRVESMLYDNVTVYGTWIETQSSNVSQSFAEWSRIINNVSLAMPHPGVYTAAVNESMNHILQPSDLDGVGSYNVSGSVVSPAANVLCVNMSPDELAPLVYTAWPNANTTATGWGNQTEAFADDWYDTEVPVLSPTEWLNSTVVDDIFGWGEKYDRRPPVFELYPADNNFYANDSMPSGASVYFIAKSRLMSNYTVCELHSWPAIQCSTRFDVSGMTGMTMSADCAQTVDSSALQDPALLAATNQDAYVHHMTTGVATAPQPDWKFFAQGWITSLSLSGGLASSNSSLSRLLTESALREPALNASLPSLAEGFAALLANTLVTSSLDTPFVHYWSANETILPGAGELASFPARVRSQEYASWHAEKWQGVFYPVLLAAFLLNLLCLAYFCRVGLVKDFLEPTSLFAIATRSSAAAAAGVGGGGGGGAAPLLSSTMNTTTRGEEGEESVWVSGGGGGRTSRMSSRTTATMPREKAELVVPYRLAYRQEADHYVFEEADGSGGGDSDAGVTRLGGGGDIMASSGVELEEGLGNDKKKKRYSRVSRRPIF